MPRLPLSPADGQVCDLMVDSRVVWKLRYNASTCKWEFVG